VHGDALPDIRTVVETVRDRRQPLSPAPEPIIARLNREIDAGLNDPRFKARLAELTVTPLHPSEFGVAEPAKWAKVIELASIKAE
jgi:hypothetical protein